MKTFKRKNKKKTARFRFDFVKGMMLALALFVVAQIFFAIHISSSGAKLIEIENRKKELQRKNLEMSQNLVNSTSLSQVYKTADEMGFEKTQQAYYIQQEEFVAKSN